LKKWLIYSAACINAIALTTVAVLFYSSVFSDDDQRLTSDDYFYFSLLFLVYLLVIITDWMAIFLYRRHINQIGIGKTTIIATCILLGLQLLAQIGVARGLRPLQFIRAYYRDRTAATALTLLAVELVTGLIIFIFIVLLLRNIRQDQRHRGA